MSYKDPSTWKTSVSVPSWLLRPVGTRPPLEDYFKQLWRRRHFILAESKSKVAGANSKAIMGNLWLVGNPLLQALMYFVIFGLIMNASRGVDNFLAYLIVGLFHFFLTMRAVSGGVKVIGTGRSMIRAFAFPRASLPISLVLQQLYQFGLTWIVMIVFISVVPPAENITWRVVLIVPALVLQVMFVAGCVFFVARIGHKIPDISNLLSVVTRFWLYGSGVIFPIERFITDPFWQSIVQLNPMWIYLDMQRSALVYGTSIPAWEWIMGAGWALGFLILGFVFFYYGEEEYGRDRN
ncbi:ABC transporter permease [Brevibacterium samyangense]|uniref:Transport permease protein n=1 Tax=Brevibacterium samyangense TaxID=366888 RepID=A0ABP5F6Z9_9MICO